MFDIIQNHKAIEVVIIGGGLSGCATAYFLSKGGLRVLIIERRNIASGASGRNGSCITKMDSRTLTPARVRKRLPYVLASLELLKSLEFELETGFDLQQFGALDIASSESEIDEILEMVRNQRDGGDEGVNFLEREGILSKLPLVGESAIAAKYTETDGSLDPIKLTCSLARTAYKKYNIDILTNTKVIRLIKKRNRVTGILTDKGLINTDCLIINCTNAWLNDFEQKIPIFPVKSVVSVTEKTAPLPIITWESNHLGFYTYGTSQKKGNLLIGTLPAKIPDGPFGHFDESVDYEDLARHGMLLHTLFPKITEISIIRTWAGVFCMTPDRLPYVGPMPEFDNYFINAGYSNGMCYCPVGSFLFSEYLLNNGKTSIPIDTLDPGRFYDQKFELPQSYNYDMLERYLGEWDL